VIRITGHTSMKAKVEGLYWSAATVGDGEDA